jgi:hypothetical protein
MASGEILKRSLPGPTFVGLPMLLTGLTGTVTTATLTRGFAITERSPLVRLCTELLDRFAPRRTPNTHLHTLNWRIRASTHPRALSSHNNLSCVLYAPLPPAC